MLEDDCNQSQVSIYLCQPMRVKYYSPGIVVGVESWSLRHCHQVVHPHGGGSSATSQEECGHLTLPLHLHLASTLELVMTVLEHIVDILRDLGMVGQTRGVHPAGHIDCVAPDIILWLPTTNQKLTNHSEGYTCVNQS